MKLTRAEVRRINLELAPLGIKYCNGCDKQKPFEEFGKHLNRIKSKCRQCANNYASRYREANRVEIRRREKIRRSSQPEKFRASQVKYRSGGRNPDKPWPPGTPTYSAAHKRPLAVNGPAGQYQCCTDGCTNQASDWAYNGEDENEYTAEMTDSRNGSTRTIRYSGNPLFYQPMCRPCHTVLDKRLTKERGACG